MSKELKHLMQLVKLKQFEQSPPKKILYHILDEIEDKVHYGRMRCWDILIELLANWTVQNEDLSCGSCSCKPFEGLKLQHVDLYNHINNLDLFKHYAVASKKQPWDYIGEIYMESGLVGPGENMTPRSIVEMMLKMVLPAYDKKEEEVWVDKQTVVWGTDYHQSYGFFPFWAREQIGKALKTVEKWTKPETLLDTLMLAH